jgi:hypothetical protein
MLLVAHQPPEAFSSCAPPKPTQDACIFRIFFIFVLFELKILTGEKN